VSATLVETSALGLRLAQATGGDDADGDQDGEDEQFLHGGEA
jgi:hypothetical protein